MKSVTTCKDNVNSRTLNANVVCATCNKCLVDSNPFAHVTKMLNDVHAKTKKPTVVPISTRKPKIQANKSTATPNKKKVASKPTNQKPQSYFRVLYENTNKAVYYVEGLNHNLFSVGQFCDANLEVAFRKSTCFVRDLQGYTNSSMFMASKAFSLNFDYINLLLKKDIVIGLPKLKYVKDQICSYCELSKAKRSLFKSKAIPSSKERLNLLYMDLCGPMRVASINRKKYILVIVDDYSRYTWTLFLRSKDETPEVLKDFLMMIQRNLQAQEEVYVAQSEGFVDPDHPEKVYRLRKALYGLKQAPRAWYDELSKFLTSKGFTKGTIDPTLFTIRYGEDILLVQIYAKYTLEILHKHGMDKGQSICTPIATKPKLDADLSGNPVDQTDYRSKIGSLMYLTSSRPDIVQAICFCVRYQSRLTEKHLKEVKRIFRYLRGTVNRGLWYPKDSSFELTAFSDADHAGCIDSRKSTSGGIQLLVKWMRTQLQDYGFNYNKIPLYYDSQSAIAISCNPVQHSRTMHIHTRYHFIKEQVENGIIELYFVRTEYQLADMFTKALPKDRFKYLVRRIGMRCLTPAELEVLAKESA
nr:hypothetical protein [Tanacetum cinerariifolium]